MIHFSSPTHSFDQLVTKIKQDLVRGVTASWKVWPLVHVINFRFIPPQQRLLYINSIQVWMDAYMSGLGAFGPIWVHFDRRSSYIDP